MPSTFLSIIVTYLHTLASASRSRCCALSARAPQGTASHVRGEARPNTSANNFGMHLDRANSRWPRSRRACSGVCFSDFWRDSIEPS